MDDNPAIKDAPAGPTVAEEADKAIRGDRKNDYGHPRENFRQIADAWSMYLMGRSFPVPDEDGGMFGDTITEHDVAVMMVLVKCMRMSGGYHRDSAVDIIGYAALDAIVEGDDEL